MISKSTTDLNKEIQQLRAENKRLKDKVDYATGFTANTLMEHNVSGTFIIGYIKTFGDKDEWVNIAYVKEIFGILAKPSFGGKRGER